MSRTGRGLVRAKLEAIETRTDYSADTVRLGFENVYVEIPADLMATDDQGNITLKLDGAMALLREVSNALIETKETILNARTRRVVNRS